MVNITIMFVTDYTETPVVIGFILNLIYFSAQGVHMWDLNQTPLQRRVSRTHTLFDYFGRLLGCHQVLSYVKYFKYLADRELILN